METTAELDGLMKTPISYYGGKQNMLKYLLELIPEHKIYCEPFFGGGALFFAKPKSEVEVINDKNGEVINFFKIVKTKFSELQKEIKATLHSRELYKQAMVVYAHPELFSDVKRAWALWTLTNQGFASMIGSWGFGRENSKEKAVANKREDFTKEYAERLKSVQIESNDALKVIDRCDSKETFFYCDPPYIGSDMGHYAGYSDEDYEKLLDKLSKVKGKFLLSSYPSKILTGFIRKHKWKSESVKKFVAVTKLTEKKKTEMLVYNFDPEKTEMMDTKEENLSGSGSSPAVKRAERDAKGYYKLPLSQLKMILRLENDAELEDGLTPEIKIRKVALLKAIAEKEGLAGKKKKGDDPYKGIAAETQFMRRLLEFHNKVLWRKTFEIFIDDLQKAIREKKITKKSPVAKEIMAIQNAAIAAYNSMKSAKHFVLKPATIAHLNKILERHENAFFEEEDKPTLQTKKKPTPLSGLRKEPEDQPESLPDNKIMSSIDFAKEKFSSIGFKDKWLDLIGDPSPGFTVMVFGRPKMGKSYLCIDLAGYLARNHGKVLYVAKEEKLDATLQKKLTDKDVAHENLFVSDFLPDDLSEYDFIILDSVNKLDLSPQDLTNLKAKNLGKSFIFIFQTTKEGKFRGANTFQHDVDVVIEIPEQGKAVQFGRFNQGGEMQIFEPSESTLLEGINKGAKTRSKKQKK
jgi:DNA adenine methylase